MNGLCRFVVLLAVLAPGTLTAQSSVPGPILTNKRRFRIPFRYDAQELQRLGAKEIRLFVSTDFGATWRPVQAVAPETGYFEFQALSDGEYWFAVRTVDAHNQLHPSGSQFQPGLKVVVDTTPPTLQLTLRELEPGRVGLEWRADDPYLEPSTLRLEYIQPGMSDWQVVTVPLQAAGQTAWSVPQGGIVAVRGSVADRAGNVRRSQVQVHVDAAGTPGGPAAPPSFRQPIATDPQGQFAAGQQSPAQLGGLTTPSNTASPQATAGGADTLSTHEAAEPLAARTTLAHPAGLAGSGAGTVSAKPSAWSQPKSAGGPTVRLVNSTKFQISYRVDEVGPSGLSKIELFITQDGGQKWWKYGDDPDLRSPFDVEVPSDGAYGFAIRVRSGVGLGDPPPQPGERPTIVIVVDQTPPTLQLLPVQQGAGSEYNKVLIRWNMTDENPADRPIALYYAPTPNGPWEPISGWIPNTGSYLWSIQPGVPTRLFIQIAARDAAGNISTVRTERPLIVDLTRPSARIVDVESVGPPLR